MGLMISPKRENVELKVPLICRVPRTMNRQGNRTTNEGSSDLEFQNLSLQKNRLIRKLASDGHLRSVGGHGLASMEPQDRNFAAVLDGAKGHSDDDYEEPELQMVEAWQSIKILPARPVRESEYADTRYFKGVMDLPRDPKTSIPNEGKPWNTPVRLEETPLPPPRLPIALPRKYQPLPPEPESSRSLFPQRHTFPEAWRGPKSTPSFSPLSDIFCGLFSTGNQNYYPHFTEGDTKCLEVIVPQYRLSASVNSGAQVHKGSLQSYSPQHRQSPVGHSSRENKLPDKNTSRRKPFSTLSGEKDVQHHDWYIGECSRRAVEEALTKENKDGTFLVRDCSSKSKAEPYVLVVFYGNKVYNVKIRFLERNQQFALGTGLRGDEKFDSVEDIIEHYKYFPITLIDGKDKTGAHREQCYLTQPLPLHRYFSPR
ncbi:cytokine-dependent hematopoietic cell linker [Dugong dugon]